MMYSFAKAFFLSSACIIGAAFLFYAWERWSIKHKSRLAEKNIDRELLIELHSLIEQLSGGVAPRPGSVIDRIEKHLDAVKHDESKPKESKQRKGI